MAAGRHRHESPASRWESQSGHRLSNLAEELWLAEAAGLASAPLEELRKQAMMYPANVHLKRRIERLSALAAAAPVLPPPRRD